MNAHHAPTTNEQVCAFVGRLERLDEEKAGLAQDFKDVLDEAASVGLSKKALKEILRLRKLDKSERDALMADVDLYMNALGMLADTPLGDAAMKRAQAAGEVRPDKPKPARSPEADIIDLEALPPSDTRQIAGPKGGGHKRVAGPTPRLPAPAH